MKLLSHLWNTVSSIYILLWLLLYFTLPLLFPSFSFPKWIGLLNAVMILIACFSAERVEDEMITQMRLRAVKYTALLALAVEILRLICSYTGWDAPIFNDVIALQGDFFFWVLLFFALFKIQVIIEKWRSKND